MYRYFAFDEQILIFFFVFRIKKERADFCYLEKKPSESALLTKNCSSDATQEFLFL